ncbi:biotin/lipoyl-containing protein [Propionivibrio sp.]|uniref:biotin/lipoyl-containing protein n=1 Tax=Propionivibrio sp. TaxID=2212460 RepID=UPI0026388C53|nr:biotin/lipoyl-containing protein [Propionivibrio sp.]
MRRYTLDISDRKFVIDVQELAADRFEVFVGDESYEVTLSGDENLAEAAITPGLQPRSAAGQRASTASTVARVRKEPSSTPAASPAPRKAAGGAGGKGALTAPMPGVILEVCVKAGDQIERGQQVAILDAMKMHNVIGAPRAGTVAEVFVVAGQNVDHGDAIIKFKED